MRRAHSTHAHRIQRAYPPSTSPSFASRQASCEGGLGKSKGCHPRVTNPPCDRVCIRLINLTSSDTGGDGGWWLSRRWSPPACDSQRQEIQQLLSLLFSRAEVGPPSVHFPVPSRTRAHVIASGALRDERASGVLSLAFPRETDANMSFFFFFFRCVSFFFVLSFCRCYKVVNPAARPAAHPTTAAADASPSSSPSPSRFAKREPPPEQALPYFGHLDICPTWNPHAKELDTSAFNPAVGFNSLRIAALSKKVRLLPVCFHP